MIQHPEKNPGFRGEARAGVNNKRIGGRIGLIDRARVESETEWSRVGGEDHQTLVQTLITSHDESADCGGKLGEYGTHTCEPFPLPYAIALTSGVAPSSIAAHLLRPQLLRASSFLSSNTFFPNTRSTNDSVSRIISILQFPPLW